MNIKLFNGGLLPERVPGTLRYYAATLAGLEKIKAIHNEIAPTDCDDYRFPVVFQLRSGWMMESDY